MGTNSLSKGGICLDSTSYTDTDKPIFITKDEIFLMIKEFVESRHSDLAIVENDDISRLINEKVNSINSEAGFFTQKYRPIDIIRHFSKDYSVQYVPIVFPDADDYYIFKKKKKKRFIFF